MSDSPDELRMEISGLLLDPASNVPIVILRGDDGEIFLPIWIGVFEADAIARRIEGQEPPRPMTHDLLLTTAETLGATVEKVVVTDLQSSTFHATIVLRRGDEELTVDSRPSDALALALRAEAPIFVRQGVIEKAQSVDVKKATTEEDKIRKMLEELGPEDLGEYTM